MIGHQRRVGGAARQAHLAPALVDHEFVRGVSLEDAAHEPDVVQEAGADEMQVVGRLDPLLQHPAPEDVPPDRGHEHGVLEIVVEGVALGDRLDGAASERPEPLGLVLVGRAKDVAEVLGEELPELSGRHGRDGLHPMAPPENAVPLRNPMFTNLRDVRPLRQSRGRGTRDPDFPCGAPSSRYSPERVNKRPRRALRCGAGSSGWAISAAPSP